MDFLKELLERKEVWALIGILFGFSLTEGTRFLRQVVEDRRLRKALFDELNTNYYQLEHKKDTIINIIVALDKKQLLPASSVPSATGVFDTSLGLVIRRLKPIERDVIQNIYGRLQVVDRFFAEFEANFTKAIREKVVTDPWAAYKSMLNDLSDSCGVAQELILSVLKKNPVDIYGRKSKEPIETLVFAGVVTPEITRRQRGE